MHYLDGANWLPLDTTVTAATDRTGYAWQNGLNAFGAYFKALTSDEYLRLETQDRAFTFTLADANPLATGIPTGSQLSYPGVFPSTDLRYTMLPDGLKEAFVLADATAPTHYRFRLSPADGEPLQAEAQPDGSWTFGASPDTPLFSIPAPYARDSAHEDDPAATHASLSVHQDGNDFLIDLEIVPAWLQDPSRSFPVVLDPTITVQPASLDEDFQNPCPQGQSCPFPGTDTLGIGGDGHVGSLAATKFTSLGIPSVAYVTDASAGLRFLHGSCFENSEHQPCSAHNISAYRMTSDWTTSTRTENLAYDPSQLGDWYELPPDAPSQWMGWDITDTAHGWVDGTLTNYGLLFKRNPETTSAIGPIVPASGYTGDQTLRPKLVITYHLPPDQPVLETPTAGPPPPALDTTTPVLRASFTDPDSDPVEYLMRVTAAGADCPQATPIWESGWLPGGTAISTTPRTATVAPAVLKDGTTYTWCVQARDRPDPDGHSTDYQLSPWSVTRSFDIRLKKLGVRDYWPMWSRGPLAVNEANGNLVLSLPGPSYPYGTNSTSASVSYNSQAASTGGQGLGPRWSLDTGADVSPPAKLVDHNLLSGGDQFDAVERVSGDGSSDYYTHVAGSNTYLSTPGDGAQLTKNADSSWTLLDPDGTIYTFRPADPQTGGVATLATIEFVDAARDQTPLYYCFDNSSGKVTSIRTTDTCPQNGGTPPPSPPELRFKWASVESTLCVDAVLCVTGPDGVTWKYIGDAGTPLGTAGKLVKINDGSRDIAAISYNDQPGGNGLASTIQNANDLDPIHASPGYNPLHALKIGYDASNRVQSVSDGPVTNQTPATSTWSFIYNTPCPVPTTATRAAHAGTPLGTVRGNDGCTDMKPPRQQGDPNPKILRIHYDNLGHPIQVTDLFGNVTMKGYDERDQLLWSEDEDGNPSDISYADVEGNPTTNPWVATAQSSVTGPDPDGISGPLGRPVTRTRYDETQTGEDLLTTSGGLITDSVRAAGTEGDGRDSPDSSFGIWEGTTNLVTNGGFEPGVTGWNPSQANLSPFTLRSKFGGKLMRVTSTGTKAYSADTFTTLTGSTGGRTFTGSFWVYAEGSAVGKTLSATVREEGGLTGQQETANNRVLVAGWQRISATRTLAQNDRTTVRLLALRPSGVTSGEYFDLDGAQLEEKPVATPYVETTGGPASRPNGRVQVPSSFLGGDRGWVALRMRVGVSSTGSNLRLFTWGANANDELYLRYGSGSFRMGRVISGSPSEAQQPASFAPGDTVTVIGSWFGAGLTHPLEVSVNGAAFSDIPNGGTSQPEGTTFDLGQRGYSAQDFSDSDILWASFGTGTLSNADAAAIAAWGNETPGTWSYPPSAQATAAWTADSATYQQSVPSAGPSLQGLQAAYYDNANLAGRPKALQNDSSISNWWGDGGPANVCPDPSHCNNFSIRWSGYLKVITAGSYVLSTVADEAGTNVTLDGASLISAWGTAGNNRLDSQPITLTAGLHKLVVDYHQETGSSTAQMHLRWACSACGIDEIVSPGSLRPAWFNGTSSVSPAGRTSFSHFPNPANGRSDYSLSRLLDGTNVITSLSYDNYGRIAQKVMPKGNLSRTIDSSGNLQGSPSPAYAKNYVYYGPGETASLPLACGSGLPINQLQLLKSTSQTGIATTTFVYNAAGRPVAKTNDVGSLCSSFDSEGRLTSTKAPGDAQQTTYTYDPAGAQRTATDASGTITSEYDEQGRLKRSLDSFGAEAVFTYDAEGDTTQRQAATGPLNPGPSYSTNYVYDAEGAVTRVTDPSGRSYTFFYDKRGNLKATWYEANHTFSWNDYDAGGSLTALYNRHGDLSAPLPASVPADASPIADFAYAYEQDGKKTQQTRTGGNNLPTEIESYRFDGLGRMDAVTLPDGTARRYGFDLDSNRTQITENGQTPPAASYSYAANGADQLTSATESGQGRSFAYRPDGEMTSRGADTLTWDGWGRLTGGTFSGTSVSYGFDPAGFRRQRIAGGQTTRYLHGGMFETDASGAITLTDVDGAAGDLAHFAGPPTTGSTVTYLYYNGHGDLAAEADSAGTRTTAYTYDPFGAPKQTQPTNKAIERFTGRWDKKLDTATNLIEMGARPYDPKLGRFLAVDPVDGGSLNNYDYAGQDPVNGLDLSGLADECTITSEGCGLNTYEVWQKVQTGGAVLVAGTLGYELARVVKKCQESGRCSRRQAVHHIVAQRDRRAREARRILHAVGIGVNNPVNLVRLPEGVHQRLHTTEYYRIVNERLKEAFGRGGSGARARVIGQLREIARELRSGSAGL